MDKSKVVELAKVQIERHGKLAAWQHGTLEDIARGAGRDVNYRSTASEQSARQAVLNVLEKSGEFKVALERSTLAGGRTVRVFYKKEIQEQDETPLSEVGKAHRQPQEKLTIEQVLKDCAGFTRIAGWEWEITWWEGEEGGEWAVSEVNNNKIFYHSDDFAQVLTVYRELEIVNEPPKDDSDNDFIQDVIAFNKKG